MRPPLFEQLARRDSPVHRRDARLKLIAALATVVALVAIPPAWSVELPGGVVRPAWIAAAAAAAMVAVVGALAGLPVGYRVRRLLAFAPFAALLTLPVLPARGWAAGWEPALLLFTRSLTAFAVMTTLICTTPVPDLLSAMRRLRVPGLLVSIASFMYRYLFVLAGELERMRQARAARTFRSDRAADWKLLPRFIAVLFIRAFERSERLYAAMCARGFGDRTR